HSYAAGSYSLSVSLNDGDGGMATQNSSGTKNVNALYKLSAIQPPFNADGSSVWKSGSTIPVKVIITDCAGNPVPGLKPMVGTTLVSSSDPGVSIDESPSTSAADTTGYMRYDPTAGQYIYNFGSGTLKDSTASYYMTVKGTG